VLKSNICQGSAHCKDKSDLAWCNENDCGYQFACTSNDQCVEKGAVCSGFAQCQDKSDLFGCKEEERRYEQPVESFYTRCNTTFGYPGQQVYTTLISDGKYHCLDRSDEEPFVVTEENSVTDYMVNCSFGTSGVWNVRQGRCELYGHWCNSDMYTLQTVCSNRILWADKPCKYEDYEGTRCTGINSGQCFYNNATYDFLPKTCEDKSDQKHQQNTTCPDTKMDNHKCQDSCSKPANSCQACTNPDYFICSKIACILTLSVMDMRNVTVQKIRHSAM
jgi:hypothetical protein